MDALLPDLAGCRLLLIEEEADGSLLMKTCFLRKGCTVFCSHSVPEAEPKLEAWQPEAVMISPGLVDNGAALVRLLTNKVPGLQWVFCGKKVLYRGDE